MLALGVIERIALVSSACLVIASCACNPTEGKIGGKADTANEATSDKNNGSATDAPITVTSSKDLFATIGARKSDKVKDLLSLSIKSENDCLRYNGEWGPQGRARQPGCIIRTEDFGRNCSSSSQCQSHCVVSRQHPRFLDIKVGERVQGRCDSTNRKFGCRLYVEGGVFVADICKD